MLRRTGVWGSAGGSVVWLVSWVGRACLGCVAVLVAMVVLAPPARAASSWEITSYRADVVLDQGGRAHVSLTLDFDFGSDPGHGPYLVIPERQAIADDPDHWWTMEVTFDGASSPSGADATAVTSRSDGNLWIRIGSEGRTFTGVQTYVVDYSVRGLVASRQRDSGLDEFNWNAVGTAWQVPIAEAVVTVRGPVVVSRAECYHGVSFSRRCAAVVDGGGATFTSRTVPGEGMQVVAGFPAGTFTDAQPVLTPRDPARAMLPVSGAVTVGAGGLAAWLIARSIRRHGRDQVYLGMPPGTIPPPGGEPPVGHAGRRAPVTVAFSPPAGARPGELGTLLDATADDRDITATIVDLAVRGHLSIRQEKRSLWRFTRLASQEPLVDYEWALLDRMFRYWPEVTSRALRDEKYSSLRSSVRSSLYERVSEELHWFVRDPSAVSARVRRVGTWLIVGGVVLAIVFFCLRWLYVFGLVAVVPVVSGIVIMCLHKRFGARTALGSAVLAQTKGFELYLATAEADQLRWEEGQDIFSKYLPYAIAFGVADRWTRLFQKLMADGRYQPPATGWYLGYGAGYTGVLNSGFVGSMSSLTSTISASMTQAASPATSGGSGFSSGGDSGSSGGGGGFGGGGGGGW